MPCDQASPAVFSPFLCKLPGAFLDIFQTIKALSVRPDKKSQQAKRVHFPAACIVAYSFLPYAEQVPAPHR